MNPAIIAAIAASTQKSGEEKNASAAKAELTESGLYGCILVAIVIASFAASAIALLKALS